MLTSSLELKDQLKEKEKELQFDDRIMGVTLLTHPGYISAPRAIMLGHHFKQYVNLNEPQFPKVFTNYENMVGKYSTNYFKSKSNVTIVDKVCRFSENPDHLYILFTYDEDKKFYDVIEKKICENLTEKFGFSYDSTVMDSKEVDDRILKDEVLYKSLSYDEDMNYCYGLNATVLYMLHNHTIEDAAVCSESFAKRMTSKDIESVVVSVNDNDIFCNIYGDKNEYKCFPDIGETIQGQVVCATRRIHNTQLLYDLKRSNLRKINSTSDTPYYCDGKIIDIVIYCNKEIDDLDNNDFNKQILKYLKDQRRYYTKIFSICKRITESGDTCSDYIKYLYKRSKEILDPVYKWRCDDGSSFSHIMMEFLVEKDASLMVGSKITGVSGDKSVISAIVPDNEMPFIEINGKEKRVELLLNSLGVVNRLNSWQLFQVSINFICNRVIERLYNMTDLKEKEKLLFDIVKRFNTNQSIKLKEYYKQLSKKDKIEFFNNMQENGIFIHIPPLWETEREPLFDRLNAIYKEYPWIEPYDVYVNKFGRKIKILKKLVVAEKYIIKMKQTSKKGFSARSTGSISKQGLPSKSSKAKDNLEQYSKTPIRLGIDENINTCIGADPKLIAKLHLFYRSSVVGRKELSKSLSKSIKELDDFKYRPDFKNRNVEMLQAYLKCLGYKLVFDNTDYKIKSFDTQLKTRKCSNGKLFLGDGYSHHQYEKEIKLRDTVLNETYLIGSEEEIEKRISERMEAIKEKDKYYRIGIISKKKDE